MIHPSGIETSDFEIYEPSKLQIANAARVKEAYPGRPRYRLDPELLIKAVLLAAGLIGLVKLIFLLK